MWACWSNWLAAAAAAAPGFGRPGTGLNLNAGPRPPPIQSLIASGRRLELHQRLIPARGLRGEPGRGGGPGLKIDSESPVTRDSEPGCLPLSDWQAQAEPLSRSRLGAASAPDSEPTVGQCAGAGPGCQ